MNRRVLVGSRCSDRRSVETKNHPSNVRRDEERERSKVLRDGSREFASADLFSSMIPVATGTIASNGPLGACVIQDDYSRRSGAAICMNRANFQASEPDHCHDRDSARRGIENLTLSIVPSNRINQRRSFLLVSSLKT